MLASPWDEASEGALPAPIVLTAWQAQIQLHGLGPAFHADDVAAENFVSNYIQGGPLSMGPETTSPCATSASGTITEETKASS